MSFERGSPGANYFVSDNVPLERREVIDRVTNALGLRRVGRRPGWVVGLSMGFPLVEATDFSIRMRSDHIEQYPEWVPPFFFL